MASQMDENQSATVKEALQRFVDVYLKGQRPDIDDFVKQYPQHEVQLKKRIQDLQEIDTLFDSIFQAERSEFEDEAAANDLVGRKIGSFEITEMIGRGGMGVVYLAYDTKLKRSVAVKSMPVELQTDPAARTRFRREAELLASLNHPNIAAIYDIVEQDEGAGYLILEYVPGETLAERLAREPLKLEQALSVGRQVAEAISAAHKKGIVHRDLKPGNIKITPDGQVKVLDFGLAKPHTGETENAQTTATQRDHIMGTPAYMSPEQARGEEADHHTDIWSFGCIIYQMLTGYLPFEGQTATDTLARIIEREPDWAALPQETPTSIRTLVQRCLEKNPDSRPSDIAEAITEITKALGTPEATLLRKLTRAAMFAGAAVIVVLAGVWFSLNRQAKPSSEEIRLVILPFDNLGPAEDEWFADGMTDEITSRLARIHRLGVISRQSAMQYKARERSARVIHEELGVDYILEGTIQRERPWDPNSRIRIRAQLIKATEDIHIWTETYDKNMIEIFQLQSDVAEQVAQGLDITLLRPERKALASRPTQNVEAYGYYLRGNEYSQRSNLESDIRIAVQMYEKAVELDPNFALAYAQLSRCHLSIFWSRERSDARLTLAKQAVDKSLELSPDLPEVRLALGHYYYHGHLNYDRALEQFAIARKSQPNNDELLSYIGYVQRRQGKLEQALANQEKASELNPLSISISCEIGLTYLLLRKHTQAERWYERAILLAPDDPRGYYGKAWAYIRGQGSTKKARAVLEEGLKNVKSEDSAGIVNSLIHIDVFDENYQEALDRLSFKPEDVSDPSSFDPIALRYALIYRYMGDNGKAEQNFEQAISILKSKIREDPNDARYRSSLGIAYAGLGRRDDAIREGELGVELLPVTKDFMGGLVMVSDLARIYVMAGEFDAAIEKLESLLTKPGAMTKHLLLLDPAWDPIRTHPGFKKLVESGK